MTAPSLRGADSGSGGRDAPDILPNARLFKGGAFLFGGQIGEYGLKLIGLFLITRVLGPESYAAYITALSIYSLPIILGRDGMLTRLVALPESASAEEGTIYTLQLLQSFLLLGLSWTCSEWITASVNVPGASTVLSILVLAAPLQLTAVPAFAGLHRSLNYQAIATIDFAGQIVYYAAAVPLVLGGAGAAGLACSFVIQCAFRMVAAHWYCRKIPRFRFDVYTAMQVCRFSFSYSLIGGVWQLRNLISYLIVGHWLGAHAVGIIGMANTVVELVSFAKSIGFKIALAVFGRVGSDPVRLQSSTTEAFQLQTLVVGSMLLGFGWASDWVVPLAFGERWRGILDLYPFIALSCLANAQFLAHAAALVSLGRNLEVALVNLVHVALLATAAIAAVPTLGIVGYGWAELATLPAYALLHLFVARRIGSPDYRLGALWFLAAGVGLFWRELGVWTIAVPFLALAPPFSLRYLRKTMSRHILSGS